MTGLLFERLFPYEAFWLGFANKVESEIPENFAKPSHIFSHQLFSPLKYTPIFSPIIIHPLINNMIPAGAVLIIESLQSY